MSIHQEYMIIIDIYATITEPNMCEVNTDRNKGRNMLDHKTTLNKF